MEGPVHYLEKLNLNKYRTKVISNGKIFMVHADNILSRSDIFLESDKSEKNNI